VIFLTLDFKSLNLAFYLFYNFLKTDMQNLQNSDPIEKFQNIFHLYLKDNPMSVNDHNRSLRFGKLLLILKNLSNITRRELIGKLFFSKIIKTISIENLIEEILKNRIFSFTDLLVFFQTDFSSTNFSAESRASGENNLVNIYSKTPQIPSYLFSNFNSFNPFFD
jgi:hypothetical protein